MAGEPFQVHVLGRSIVKATSHPSAPYLLRLSNLDLFQCSYPAVAFYVYPNPSGSPFTTIAATVKASLPSILDHFPHLSGRFSCADAETADTPPPHYVICNNEGAEVVEAASGVPLSSVDFHQVRKSLDLTILPRAPDLVLSVQVVGFACGGFTITWSSSHLVLDAHGFDMLTSLWAELARTGKIISTIVPTHDRSMFRPRAPPTYNSEIDRHYTCCTRQNMADTSTCDSMDKKLYHVDGRILEQLRETASGGGKRPTRVEAFSAYVWKILASVPLLSGGAPGAKCRRMGWLVDGRSRMVSDHYNKVVAGYTGNLITTAAGEMTVKDLTSTPLSAVSSNIQRAIGEVAHESHFLDLVDWLETHGSRSAETAVPRVFLGTECPTVVVASRKDLRMEVDFGFGGPTLGNLYMPGGGAGLVSGFMTLSPALYDGINRSWVVCVNAWPELTDALETDPLRVFQPLSADILKLKERRAKM